MGLRKPTRPWLWSAKVLWSLSSLAVLLVAVRGDGSETWMFLGISMLILSAPLGMVVMLVWGTADLALSRICGAGIPGETAFMVLLWGLLATAGYVQWFVALPQIVRAQAARRRSTLIHRNRHLRPSPSSTRLGLRLIGPVRSAGLVAVGLACLVTGSEIFFRHADLPPARLAALGLIGAGVLAFGLAAWSVRLLAIRAAAALVYGAYLAQACWRFPGLIKDYRPYAATDVAWLVLRVEVLLALPMLVIAGLAGYWMRRRSAVSPTGDEVDEKARP